MTDSTDDVDMYSGDKDDGEVKIVGPMIHETKKAILFGIWIPKSILINYTEVDGTVTLTIPEWWVEKWRHGGDDE